MMARKLDTKLSCCDGSGERVRGWMHPTHIKKNLGTILVSETIAKLSAFVHPQRPKLQEFAHQKVASSIFPFFPGTFCQELMKQSLKTSEVTVEWRYQPLIYMENTSRKSPQCFCWKALQIFSILHMPASQPGTTNILSRERLSTCVS